MILRTGALIAAQAGPLDTVERLLTDAFDRGLTHGMGLHADPFPRPLRQRPSFKRMIRPIGQR